MLRTIKTRKKTSKASKGATRGEAERERDISVAEQGTKGEKRKVMV